ncbi:hypothetical protein OB13_20370 [Pontibacter sp. HJ8]
MLTLRQLIEKSLTLPDKVLDSQVNIQLEALDEHGNATMYVMPLDLLYVLHHDSYVGPSGILSQPELEQLTSDAAGIDADIEESMEDYDLYLRKDQAILYAQPLHFKSPKAPTPPLRVYSHELDDPSQGEPASEQLTGEVPHMRVENE